MMVNDSSGLREYLSNNFYPPPREEVIDSWVLYFKKYWDNEISFKELLMSSPIDTEELLNRFSYFIKEEDIVGDLYDGG